MKISPISLFALFFLSMQSNVVMPAQADMLSLNCTAIPFIDDRLCYVTTDNPLGPYEDVVLFRKTTQQELHLLGSKKDGVATFGGVGFSEGGRYMWLEWAEEGHPSFVFYSTQYFLSDGLDAPVIDTLDVYGFERFVRFSDDGMVSYTKEYDDINTCEKTTCVYSVHLNKPMPVMIEGVGEIEN